MIGQFSCGNALALVVLQTTLGAALADECRGSALQPHPLAQYNFETNSHFDSTQSVPRFFDCIHNLDTAENKWLRVEWYVTAFRDAWIAPTKAVEMLRNFGHDIVANNVRAYGSCLEYGGTGQTITAAFMSDEPEPEDARRRNPHCEEQHADSTGSSSRKHPLLPISMPMHVFVPSDDEHPSQTMLQVDGTIEYVPYSESSYISKFSYLVERYGASKGDISEIRLQPIFDGPTKSLSSYFLLSYPDGSLPLLQGSNSETLSGRGGFSFDVRGADNWFVAQAVIRFVGKSGHQLAAIQVPFYAIDP
jgi:hypothetical protein